MISVCMATYNGGRFIKEQIDSILPQLSEDDELIISDDGSTDRTLEIIASYKDERIKIFHHQKNPEYAKIKHSRNFYYATSNFENALKQARGDYIFLSDQDDIWKSDKKEIMLEALVDSKADCVMCNFSVIDENRNVLIEKFYENSPISKNLVVNILKSKFLGCCMAFSRDLLQKALPFPVRLIAHDYWIGCLSEKFIFLNEPLHFYRRYESNVSTSSEKSKNSLFAKVLFRFEFSKQLYKRMNEKK